MRLLVAMDASPASGEAMRWVADFAHRLDAEVVAVHAVGLLERLASPAITSEAAEEDIAALAETEWCAPLRQVGVRHETVVVPGDPVEQILEVAELRRVDAIVVGTRGALLSEAQRLGSTSHRIIEASTIPVVVVPPPGQVRPTSPTREGDPTADPV